MTKFVDSYVFETKYIPQTNFKPAKIKATYRRNGMSIMISMPMDCEGMHAHFKAVEALMQQMCFITPVEVTVCPHDSGYIFSYPIEDVK